MLPWILTTSKLSSECEVFADVVSRRCRLVRYMRPRCGGRIFPLQDADWTNEYTVAPERVLDRDIDLLCISRVHTLKTGPLIARALLLHHRKYPFEPIRMTLIAGKKNAYCSESMSEVERDQYTQIQRILGRPEGFIDFVDSAAHFAELPSYYSRARYYILEDSLGARGRFECERQSGYNVPNEYCGNERNWTTA